MENSFMGIGDLVVQLAADHPVLAGMVVTCMCLQWIAIIIVNLTPTPKDDAQVNKALKVGYRFVELLAGIINSRKVKQ